MVKCRIYGNGVVGMRLIRCLWLRRLKVEVHFNPWTICDRFLDAEFGSSKAEKLGNSSARQPDPLPTTRTNLAKIVHELEDRVGTSDREEETKRVLRRFSRMYMTTLAMEIDRIESELRHALPEFKCVVPAPSAAYFPSPPLPGPVLQSDVQLCRLRIN